MKYEELPKECQDCEYLKCGDIRMNRDHDYHCSKINTDKNDCLGYSKFYEALHKAIWGKYEN